MRTLKLACVGVVLTAAVAIMSACCPFLIGTFLDAAGETWERMRKQ